MKALTKKQKEILFYIYNFIKTNNYSPSFRNISDKFFMTVKGAVDHVKSIEKKGYLKHEAGIARSFQIIIMPED